MFVMRPKTLPSWTCLLLLLLSHVSAFTVHLRVATTTIRIHPHHPPPPHRHHRHHPSLWGPWQAPTRQVCCTILDATTKTTADNDDGNARLKDTTTDANVVDIAQTNEQEETQQNDDEQDDEQDEPVQLDSDVLDAMFQVGQLMSEPPTGGVTLAALSVLPPIAVLQGKSEDDDLTVVELRECWSGGSLGATRVDRQGFERVWAAIQENYYNDIVEEARERLVQRKKKKRGTSVPKPTSPPLADTTATTTTTTMSTTSTPMVGSQLTPEQLQAQIKNMKDEDMTQMFEQMSNMSPTEEDRLRAMGVDPEMMKKSASALKSNPLLRKAAAMMMKNTPPEQLVKASQEAQQKMASLSEEEKQKLMDNFK